MISEQKWDDTSTVSVFKYNIGPTHTTAVNKLQTAAVAMPRMALVIMSQTAAVNTANGSGEHVANSYFEVHDPRIFVSNRQYRIV